MRWATVIFLAFCFGLSYWEYATRRRLGMSPYGNQYGFELPRVFASPAFQILRLLGSAGIILVPLISWSQGFLWGLAAMTVFLIGGQR